MNDPINDVKNLAMLAAYDTMGVGSYMKGHDTSGPAPKWMRDGETQNRVFTPGLNNDMPKPLNVGASMNIKPVVFEVSGYIGTNKVTKYYPIRDHFDDDVRFDFQLQYNGVRGVTVHPLYDLGRYA